MERSEIHLIKKEMETVGEDIDDLWLELEENMKDFLKTG